MMKGLRKEKQALSTSVISRIPLLPLLFIYSFLGNLKQFVDLSLVSREWNELLNRADKELWKSLAKEINIKFDPISSHINTRLGASIKKNFLFARQKSRKELHDKHEALIAQAKSMFEKSPQDCAQRLQSLIKKEFPDMSDFNVNWQSPTMEGNTLLTIACRGTERLKCVQLLVEKYGSNLELGDVGGFNALITSAYHNNLACVKFLVKRGANIFALGKERSGCALTAEHWAAIKNGCFTVFEYLRGCRLKYIRPTLHLPSLSNSTFDSNAGTYNESVVADTLAGQPCAKASPSSSSSSSSSSSESHAVVSSFITGEEVAFPSREGWCVCGHGFRGDMVGCDSPICSIEWFHFECVGLHVSVSTAHH